MSAFAAGAPALESGSDVISAEEARRMTQTKAERTLKHSNRNPKRKTLKQRFKDNALSIVTILIFFVCWIGQSVSGNLVYNDDAISHGKPPLKYGEYLGSAESKNMSDPDSRTG